jgi:hypothetical protein
MTRSPVLPIAAVVTLLAAPRRLRAVLSPRDRGRCARVLWVTDEGGNGLASVHITKRMRQCASIRRA